MTEKSYWWGGTSVGDAVLAPYDDDTDWSDLWTLLFTYDRRYEGVIQTLLSTYSGLLAASTPGGSTVRIASGLAIVDGKIYTNDANIDFTVSGVSQYWNVVLQKNWVGGSAQTVRAVLKGPYASSAAADADVTQTDGTVWEVRIALVLTTAGGAVSTITDKRIFSSINQIIYTRQGGHSTRWSTGGTTTYNPAIARIQCGTHTYSDAVGVATEDVTITFPKPFVDRPIVFLQATGVDIGASAGDVIIKNISILSGTGFSFTWKELNTTNMVLVNVYWMAIGQVL